MNDITAIPLEELKDDLAASKLNLRALEKLMLVEEDSRVVEMVEQNRQIVQVIQEELKRRRDE